METLQIQFENTLKRLGLSPLPRELCSGAAPGLRFRIAGEEKIYLGDHRRPNGAYVEHGVERALALYSRLPQAPELLRIDGCPRLPFLPEPGEWVGESAYWQLPPEPPFLRKLFREIIRAELDSAGWEELTGSVYFSSPSTLFCLYDDRHADLAAADPALLEPLRQEFRDWLL